MVIYDLVCDANHQFEGWFQSSDDFGQQLNNGLLSCPICNSNHIRKIPTASHVSIGPSRNDETRVAQAANTKAESGPDDFRMKINTKLLKDIREFIEVNSEDVGSKFAEEARKMHYGEKEERNIRGRASGEEISDLRKDGINAVPLPGFLVSKDKMN